MLLMPSRGVLRRNLSDFMYFSHSGESAQCPDLIYLFATSLHLHFMTLPSTSLNSNILYTVGNSSKLRNRHWYNPTNELQTLLEVAEFFHMSLYICPNPQAPRMTVTGTRNAGWWRPSTEAHHLERMPPQVGCWRWGRWCVGISDLSPTFARHLKLLKKIKVWLSEP